MPFANIYVAMIVASFLDPGLSAGHCSECMRILNVLERVFFTLQGMMGERTHVVCVSSSSLFFSSALPSSSIADNGARKQHRRMVKNLMMDGETSIGERMDAHGGKETFLIEERTEK